MLRNLALLLATTAAIATPLAAQTFMKASPAASARGPRSAPVPIAAGSVPDKDPAFSAKLHDALLAHPEWIIEAAQNAQGRMQQMQRAEQARNVDAVRPRLMARQPVGPVIGNPAGTKTVVEFLDYACPFCKRAHVSVDDIAENDKSVRFVIVMRPVLGPGSETLARFALAADMQGKFRQANDALYDKFGDDHHTPATDENIREVAQKAGIDYDRAKRDMTSDAVEQALKSQKDLGDQLHINGTPFFVTPKGFIPGFAPEEQMKAEINR